MPNGGPQKISYSLKLTQNKITVLYHTNYLHEGGSELFISTFVLVSSEAGINLNSLDVVGSFPLPGKTVGGLGDKNRICCW